MLRLDVNDLPPALADFGGGERGHCAGRGQHRRGARLGTLDFSSNRNEGALLDLGPGYVVDRKRRDNIAVPRDVDRLAPERDERDDAAELITARGDDLRTSAMVKSHVA
jgi:hypothetical protein